jgi:hypothetical protein
MDRRVISDIPVLTANISTGVELAVYHVKKTGSFWSKRNKVTSSYEVKWRPNGGDEWNVRSCHKLVGAAVKELARLRDASDGLTFNKKSI